MDEQRQRILSLLEQFNNGSISDQDMQELIAWYESFENDLQYTDDLTDELRHKIKQDQFLLVNRKLDKELEHQTLQLTKKSHSLWSRVMVAASLLIVLSVGTYFILNRQEPSTQVAQRLKNDVAPGGDKAILTLSTGQQIILTDAGNGKLASENNTTITKSGNGQIVYENGSDDASAIIYNTMTTPKGGKYTLTLADGTVAILDAGSSVTYPVAFRGKERVVKMTGQVYFSVVHNSEKPFKVMVNDQVIEDLGTEFNVNAYEDEPIIKTTLVQGSAKIWKGSSSAMLKPGQQGVTSSAGNGIDVSAANISSDIAWKEGYFRFNDEKIESIMRKLSRWYNIDVQYVGQKPQDEFNGRMSRYKNISQVLKQLEKTEGVHFKVEGRRVTVME